MKTLPLAGLAALLCTGAAMADVVREVRFVAEIAGQPFACGQSYQLGTPKRAVMPSDFRFYVTDVALLRADGTAVPFRLPDDGRWQGQGVALLDFENGSGPCAAGGSAGTNTSLRGTVPEGAYTGLRFTMGLPPALNHQDATLAAAPFNFTAMFWNWQNGYKFLKADFMTVGEIPKPMHGAPPAGHAAAAQGHGDSGGFALHIGSTQCAATGPTSPGQDCQNPNRLTVSLTGFDPLKTSVIADPAPLLTRSDLAKNAAGTPPGCMSFPGDADCGPVFPALGLPYGTAPAGQQQLFRAR